MSKKNITNKNNIFYTQIMNEREQLEPNNIEGDIDESLLKKISKKLEGKCSKFGYVQPGSIKILERSIGRIDSSHFSGNIIFDLKLEALVCSPHQGDKIKCKVLGSNKMGIMCEAKPLLICLSKLHHQDRLEEFGAITKNSLIDVEVICSKFELYDTEINVIGKLPNLNK
tara:strand:- start:29 stop:538 length:510 start_codon:yes stop_codon:yes gene_type:complete